ncbi:hypothetical protein BDR03DRAFT_984556 [Suillus americanus]|nr:hypothetical protein BDR03DRAFT_984556 [Suillus americanus]
MSVYNLFFSFTGIDVVLSCASIPTCTTCFGIAVLPDMVIFLPAVAGRGLLGFEHRLLVPGGSPLGSQLYEVCRQFVLRKGSIQSALGYIFGISMNNVRILNLQIHSRH